MADRNLHIFPLADQFVCLDTEKNHLHVANAVGARIFALQQQNLSESEITNKLADEFDAPLHQIEQDVNAILSAQTEGVYTKLKPIQQYTPINHFVPDRPITTELSRCYYLSNTKIRVRSEEEGVLARLDEMMVLESALISNPSNYFIDIYSEQGQWPIVSNGKTRDTGLTVADTVVKVLREINIMISEQHDWLILMHASCVAKSGRGVLFPAQGGSGKTTLAAYLMAQDWKILNDDLIPLLRASLSCLPATLALSIKQGSWALLDSHFRQLRNATIYGEADRCIKYLAPNANQVAKEPTALAAIILPRYSADCERAQITSVSPLEVFVSMVESGCALRQPMHPEHLSELAKWLNQVPCFMMQYSSLQDAHTLVESVIENTH